MSTWTNSFTTLFNKAYLAKGLALCQSLERTCTEFRLFLFALDSETEMVVKQAAFPHVTVISLSQLEEYCQTLLTVKPNRNTAVGLAKDHPCNTVWIVLILIPYAIWIRTCTFSIALKCFLRSLCLLT